MPNRVIREGYLESERINALTPPAEIFFFRLMLKADDFGRYTSHASLLKAHLFPLKIDRIRVADISRWIAECEKAGLIALYVSDSKQYLLIRNFRQRLRMKKGVFPQPPKELQEPEEPDDCQTDDSHMTARKEVESEDEIEMKGDVGENGIFPFANQVRRNSSTRKLKLCDESWLKSLSDDEAYAGIDVANEHAKLLVWCRQKGKKPTQNRFIRWLNNADRTITATPQAPQSVLDKNLAAALRKYS